MDRRSLLKLLPLAALAPTGAAAGSGLGDSGIVVVPPSPRDGTTIYQFEIGTGVPGEFLVRIKPDGGMEFGPHYTPDGAAKIFWDSIDRLNPGKCRGT